MAFEAESLGRKGDLSAMVRERRPEEGGVGGPQRSGRHQMHTAGEQPREGKASAGLAKCARGSLVNRRARRTRTAGYTCGPGGRGAR